MTMPTTTNGVFLKIAATAFFAVMAAFVRVVSGRLPMGEIVFFQSTIALIVVAGYYGRTFGLLAGLKTRRPLFHLERSILGCLTTILLFFSYKFIPLANAAAIALMAPVISAFLAGLLLREHLRWPVLLSLCFGVCGVLLMFGPQFAGTSATSATLLGYVAAMSSAAIAAVNLYQVQLLRRTDTNVAIIFYFLLGASFFSLWSIAFGWQGLTIGDGLMLVGAGLFGGLGQIAVVAACRKIPMSLVASLDYCFLMWMTIIDIVVLGNIPTVSTILAVGIILSSSLLLTLLSFFPQKPRQAADRTAPDGRDLQLALVEPVGDVK